MNGGKPKYQKNDLDPITTGYIMIPKEVNRDGYIETCFRTNRVCVLVEGGLFKTDVYITNEAIQNISFPKEPGEKGTQVVIASNSFRNQPIVIGTVKGNDETPAWTEDIYRWEKQAEDASMLMIMDPKNREMSINLSGLGKPMNFNIMVGGNIEHKVKIQTSGELEATASQNIKVTGYKKIEALLVNAPIEAEEPGKEVRSVTLDMNNFQVRWRTQDKETDLTIDNNKIEMNLHDKKEHITIDDNSITIGFDNDKEQVQLTNNLIKLLTGQKVNVNNAKEPLTLANTLVQLLNNMETQITTLKTAWQTALAGSAAMDGGKAGFSAGMGVVQGISPLNFEGVKSKVIFSD